MLIPLPERSNDQWRYLDRSVNPDAIVLLEVAVSKSAAAQAQVIAHMTDGHTLQLAEGTPEGCRALAREIQHRANKGD